LGCGDFGESDFVALVCNFLVKATNVIVGRCFRKFKTKIFPIRMLCNGFLKEVYQLMAKINIKQIALFMFTSVIAIKNIFGRFKGCESLF
jgi:hypothetical protein